MPLKVSVDQKKPGAFTVSPVGSIDSDTFKDLEDAVKGALDQKAQAIVFDFTAVEYISSMGLSVIFKTKKEISKTGGTMLITNLQPKVKSIFELVKVIPSWIFENMQQADEHLDAFLAEKQKKEGK
ncbi:STAS domain-containing protein [Candidatus Omnitrophota bacterium]